MSAWGSRWQRESRGFPLGMPQGGRRLPAGLGPLLPPAPRLFLSLSSGETSSKPLMGHLCSLTSSVPPSMAMGGSELPGVLLEQNSGSDEPSLGSRQRRSVLVRLSCLRTHARLRDPCFPGPVLGPVLLGQHGAGAPGITGKGWLLPKEATTCRQHPSLEKSLPGVETPWRSGC